MTDVPSWLSSKARLVSAICVVTLVATLGLQVVEVGEELLPVAMMYFSAAVLGLDAAVHGVRKRRGVGPSIANLAPGGWAIFTAMFWIVAVPAYYFGARRRRLEDDDPREPITWGSWVTLAAFALLGILIACAPLVK